MFTDAVAPHASKKGSAFLKRRGVAIQQPQSNCRMHVHSLSRSPANLPLVARRGSVSGASAGGWFVLPVKEASGELKSLTAETRAAIRTILVQTQTDLPAVYFDFE